MTIANIRHELTFAGAYDFYFSGGLFFMYHVD